MDIGSGPTETVPVTSLRLTINSSAPDTSLTVRHVLVTNRERNDVSDGAGSAPTPWANASHAAYTSSISR